ncbi:MAG: MlaD family protein, partial [Rariglobus sp.]
MTTSHAKPKVSRGFHIPLVWLVPLVALIIGAWMLISEYRHRGPEIVIDFEDGSGIEAGKTKLEHKGVAVGLVRAVEMKPDMSGVTVRLRLDKSAAPLATEGAAFWVVQPEIGFGGVRGLDTLITGARINVRPGKGNRVDHFTGLDRAPLPRGRDGSRSFLLISDRLGSLNAGAPVFYREIKVGVVESSRLADDSASVRIRVRVDAPYADLVRTNTRFWNAGGFSFKVGLLGAELKNTSLESLVSGGISFATPDTNPLADIAKPGTQFELSRESDKDWLKWQPRISIRAGDAPANDSKASDIAPLLPSARNDD